MNTYRSYKNIPSLAGLCSMSEAMKPGLSVESCVARLKRHHYLLKRLHQIFNDRITAEPIYELKMAFSLHAHYCAEHVTLLRSSAPSNTAGRRGRATCGCFERYAR